ATLWHDQPSRSDETTLHQRQGSFSDPQTGAPFWNNCGKRRHKVAKRYAATSRFFLGCNSLGHDALGASTPGAARCTKPSARRPSLRADCHRATVVSMRDHVPAKCEVAHTSFPFSPSKVQHGDIYLARQEGTHGTKTKTS